MNLELPLRPGDAFTITLPTGPVTVYVLANRNRFVARLGIVAPEEVPVDRAEVHERKQSLRNQNHEDHHGTENTEGHQQGRRGL